MVYVANGERGRDRNPGWICQHRILGVVGDLWVLSGGFFSAQASSSVEAVPPSKQSLAFEAELGREVRR
jgi:hypothetical protein